MARATDEPLVEVVLKDGTTIHVRKPKSVYLLDLAQASSETDGLQQIRAARAFLDAAVLPVDRDPLYDRVYDPDDDLELDDMLADLIPKITEAVINRPTSPSSASSPPRRPTGKRSTGTARSGASTRAVSPAKG